MLLLCTLFILTSYSQCFTSVQTNEITNITYETSDDTCNLNSIIVQPKYSTDIIRYSFLEGINVVTKELKIDLNNYRTTSPYKTYLTFYNSVNYPELEKVNFFLNNISNVDIYTDTINDNTHFYSSCSYTEVYSYSSYSIYLYEKSNTFFYYESPCLNRINLKIQTNNFYNENGYPYLYFDSDKIINMYLYFEFNVSLNDQESSTFINNYYVYTSNNIFCNNIFTTKNSEGFTDDYMILSVCSRNDTDRNVLFYNNNNIFYTNCSCWTRNNDTEMNQSTLFNYPDCNYNSSMFDLILPSSSETYSLSDDLLEWYSIIFTTPNQSVKISYIQTLIVNELDLNQDYISFNGNVHVNNLTVTTVGSSFNTLDFDSIQFNDIEDDVVIFTIQSTSTNLESFGLKQCGYFIVKSNFNIICFYNGTSYENNNDELDLKYCINNKHLENSCMNLQIEVNNYLIEENEYWNSITTNLSSLILNGKSILTSNICEFEDKTITINCNLQCTIMIINSNTKIINNGELSIEQIKMMDVVNNNLNENGIIESYGSIEISSISVQQQSNCFELVSSNSSLTLQEILMISDYKTVLLSQNHLLRICPSTNTNYEVECTTIGNTFEQQSFDLLHCPCIDSNCIINVNTTQLDTRNIEFNGTFNMLTNSTIAISYKTSSFSIEYEDDKQILLIENGAVGFQTLNSNSLKSETTTLSIHSSNQLPCKALLIEYDNQQCIIEDNTTYPIIGDIDNCQSQNGFGCEICYEGYESKITYCNGCSSNCLRCYNDECINCEMNYQLNEENNCELISNPVISFDNNKILKCNDGYYSNTNQCNKCPDYCITCDSSECITCNTNYTLNNGNCQQKESNNGEEIISNYGVIDCNDGYYSNNSECNDCSLTFDNCELCNINGCLSCSNGVIINNGSCSLNTNCLSVDNSICLSCNDKGSWFNGNECISCGDNCKNCINGYCIECNDGYILRSENNCTQNSIPDNCITLSNYGTCQRCSDGYYLNNNLCYSCSNECSTCHNSTYCFGCNDGYMLNSNNECVDMSESNANCKTAIPGSSGGCAICNDGYYRDQTSCVSCISYCTKCNNGESCISCESNYFLLNDASECISYDDLTNCETKTQSGCTKCLGGYYLNNQYCISCSDTTENCNTCNNNGECLTCQNDYILINYECIDYQLIDNCKESNDSKCTSCSFWHTLNEDQTGCDTQVVWWVIVLIIIFILIILIGICVLIWYVTKLLFNWRKQQKQRKEVTIFDMKKSNIKFIPTNNKDVVINKDEILFNDESEEIGVNEETRDLICVGNTSKHTIKVQFSVKDGCDKYEIRTNPQLITIPKGKACEFEIFIKPLCTCKIDDQIMLISVDLTEGKTITTPITINTQTIMTSRLDYSELIEDIKLGEGSFGIVYKGTFRGNQVAIKKMKQLNNNEQMEEFNKEVSMLNKFRNDYIVHFYGAVFIPTKICMVTEFAQYGSLQDLMNKRKDNPIDNATKMKILLDCSKGISYLHSNGILHRDIKPDNFLILSLQNDIEVNAKLTDFGASRNINMLMTNMTFTKGIGTPKYMAPEILNRYKYKKSADIYSFAITMYETMIWDDAYPKSIFKHPWSIADFISNGERLPKTTTMNDSMYSLITNCWKQEAKKDIQLKTLLKNLRNK